MTGQFVRFECKRIKLEFDALVDELRSLPDPKASAKPIGAPVDLSAPLAVSPFACLV